MAMQHSRRRSAAIRRAITLFAVTGVVAGCDSIPDGGYEVVSHRQRESIPVAATPAPPPVVAGLGGGAAEIPQLAAGAPAGVTQEMVEEGAQHYGTICSACHGPGGAGTPAGPALNDGQWIHISGAFEEIDRIIHAGVPNPREHPAAMPPLGGGSFNDEQVRQISAYVFALSRSGS